MQINFKSIGYNTFVGATAGTAIGAGIGLFSVPVMCGGHAAKAVFLTHFFNGPSSGNLDAGIAAFQECQVFLPLATAISLGIGGAALGLVCGAAKEVFKNFSIRIERVPSPELPVQNPVIAVKDTIPNQETVSG